MIRAGSGKTRPLGVATVRNPVSIALGTGPDGLTAVYRRCTAAEGSESCRLATTPVKTGKEKIVPHTRYATMGTIDGSRVLAVMQRRGDGSHDGYGQELVTVRAGKVRSRTRVPRTPTP